MPYYRILTTSLSRWGEGWKFGDVVPMDLDAARVPLEKMEIELVGEEPVKKEEVAKEEAKPKEVFVCPTCGKVAKNKLGLGSHMRSHIVQ